MCSRAVALLLLLVRRDTADAAFIPGDLSVIGLQRHRKLLQGSSDMSAAAFDSGSGLPAFPTSLYSLPTPAPASTATGASMGTTPVSGGTFSYAIPGMAATPSIAAPKMVLPKATMAGAAPTAAATAPAANAGIMSLFGGAPTAAPATAAAAATVPAASTAAPAAAAAATILRPASALPAASAAPAPAGSFLGALFGPSPVAASGTVSSIMPSGLTLPSPALSTVPAPVAMPATLQAAAAPVEAMAALVEATPAAAATPTAAAVTPTAASVAIRYPSTGAVPTTAASAAGAMPAVSAAMMGSGTVPSALAYGGPRPAGMMPGMVTPGGAIPGGGMMPGGVGYGAAAGGYGGGAMGGYGATAGGYGGAAAGGYGGAAAGGFGGAGAGAGGYGGTGAGYGTQPGETPAGLLAAEEAEAAGSPPAPIYDGVSATAQSNSDPFRNQDLSAYGVSGVGVASPPPSMHYVAPPAPSLQHKQTAFVFGVACLASIAWFLFTSYRQQVAERRQKEEELLAGGAVWKQSGANGGTYGSLAKDGEAEEETKGDEEAPRRSRKEREREGLAGADDQPPSAGREQRERRRRRRQMQDAPEEYELADRNAAKTPEPPATPHSDSEMNPKKGVLGRAYAGAGKAGGFIYGRVGRLWGGAGAASPTPSSTR